MKLYLFGGAETELGQAPQLVSLINQVLDEVKPRQLLHVPFAKTIRPPDENDFFGDGWVQRELHLQGTELLDARKQEDVGKADNPTIFVNGGSQNATLYEKVITNRQLHTIIMNASIYIGESAGAMVTAQYQRYKNPDGTTYVGPGLGILKDTIIEPHYTQRNRHQLLRDEQHESGAKLGIGIDSITGIVLDTVVYPEPYQIIGNGRVEVLKASESYT